MQVRFKKLHPAAETPRRMTEGAIGYDIWATDMEYLLLGDGQYVWTYRTGIALEIPNGVVGVLAPRSSIYKTGATLCNSVGIIDSDYRGEICFKFYTPVSSPPYMPGNRVGQILFTPAFSVDFKQAAELNNTARGTGGFGST